MSNEDSSLTHTEWQRVANLIHDDYAQAEKSSVDKNGLLVVLQAFEDLYAARSTRIEERYYIGNLVQSGRLVGTRESVIGTVPGALERTRQFIGKPGPISGRQASIFTRNFAAILSKEGFNSEPAALLAPYHEVLRGLLNVS